MDEVPFYSILERFKSLSVGLQTFEQHDLLNNYIQKRFRRLYSDSRIQRQAVLK